MNTDVAAADSAVGMNTAAAVTDLVVVGTHIAVAAVPAVVGVNTVDVVAPDCSYPHWQMMPKFADFVHQAIAE
jgi:hypothetical protein